MKQDLRRELEEKERLSSRDRRSRDSGWSSSSKKARVEQPIYNTQDEDDPYDDVEEVSFHLFVKVFLKCFLYLKKVKYCFSIFFVHIRF